MLRYQANPEVVYRPESLEGAILFEPDSARVEVINLTGAYVWEHLDGERDLEQICRAVSERFEAPPPAETLQAEVERFVKALVAIGFAAEVLPPPGAP